MPARSRRTNTRQAVASLGALAHETRLAAFRLMIEAGPAGVPAGRIAERLSIPPSSLTFHLQQLLQAGLVSHRRQSRQVIYSADFAAMNGLLAFLTANCCGEPSAAAPLCDPAVASAQPSCRRTA